MKLYYVFFLILKIALIVQFLLILLNKQSVSSKVYLFTEIIFKLSVGIFIQIFLLYGNIIDTSFEDKLIISFAGSLLIFDALVNDLSTLLKEYGIKTLL